MTRTVVAVAAAGLLLAGCGAPSTVADQADALQSTAAEGELLAHDAARGATTAPFARVHAASSRSSGLDPESRGRRGPGPARRRISDELERLADEPGDREGAARVERRLSAAAARAGRLERSA